MIVGEDDILRQKLKRLLLVREFEVFESLSKTAIPRFFLKSNPDLAIIGSSHTSDWNGLDLAQQIRQLDKSIPIILITANSSETIAIKALRIGINDYFKHPFSFEELIMSISRFLSVSFHLETSLKSETNHTSPIGCRKMIGENLQMQGIKTYIGNVASTDSNVLITGETGTGKELTAELIHKNSPRYQKPFVCINCTAIPDNLLESELFGYDRGAFTGADSLKEGKLKHADGGTVFFDEIGDMSLYHQAKILRCIENKEVQRLGGKGSIPLNIRIIAATNQELDQLVEEGKFRKDLYFRLNVARVHLPPLRERKEDIPHFLDFFLRKFNLQFGRAVEGFTGDTLEYLLSYDWPGNIRELKNLLEAIFINSPSRRITFLELPEQFRRKLEEMKNLPLSDQALLLSTLITTKWNKSKTAQKLQWSRMTLYRKMAKYHITNKNKG
ncbi:MAG: sigma-54 dependent transcriptional regulator [Candidatus Brocadiaceae bacterium]